ncbi:MAG: AsmA family protein, partial [Desulfobacterales bacterium]
DIAFKGIIGDLIALSSVDAKLTASGKNLAGIGPIIGAKLPQTDDFTLRGRLTGSTDALTLKEAKGNASRGSLGLSLAGTVQDLLTLRGMDLQTRLTGKNLAGLGEVIEVKLPATDQFDIQGRLTGSTDALTLKEAKGRARRGSLSLAVNGGVQELLNVKGLNLELKASGRELADIGPLVGTELPELGPFHVSGKLSGTARVILLNELSAMVNKSDFNGRARVEFLKRTKITARLESSLIDFTALMKSSGKTRPKPAIKIKQPRRLFSDDPLPFDALEKVDADIVLKAKNLRARDAHFKLGHLSLKLEDSDLSIDKLEAVYKGTKISGNFRLHPGSPPRVATRFLVQNLDLGGLLKETGVNDQIRSTVDIAAHLNGEGDSVQSLMPVNR